MRLVVALLLVLIFLSFFAKESLSESRRGSRNGKKVLVKSLGAFDDHANAYDFTFSSEIDKLLSNSADTNLYDPLTLMQLRVLREDAQPSYEPFDANPYETRRVVEKALAIQSTTTLVPVIKKSELGDTFRAIERSFKAFTDRFRYSLQDSPNGWTVSRENKGEKLFELNLRVNLSQGLDPQIRFGDNLRLRYDWMEKQSLLECGFEF